MRCGAGDLAVEASDRREGDGVGVGFEGLSTILLLPKRHMRRQGVGQGGQGSAIWTRRTLTTTKAADFLLFFFLGQGGQGGQGRKKSI
jgi:hypothetical protein